MEDDKIRTLDELYYVEPSDMSPEELKIWIEHQKHIASVESAAKTHMDTVNACLASVAEVYREQAEEIRNRFVEMTEELQNG